MTDQEIRARCDEVSGDIVRELMQDGSTQELESLYREAMAAGLEMAAGHFLALRHRELNLPPDGRIADGSAFCFLMVNEWCRWEAQRVKEAM